MSSKRARLIRPDNFKRLSYYDVYNYTQSVKSNTLSTSSTYINKKSNYINSNRRSLKYSVALKGLKTSSTKSSQKGLSYLYPMYMSPFLNDRYDINYCNSYNIYNKVKKLKFLSCTMNKGSDILVTRRKKKHWSYKNKSWYFNTIYRHKFKHLYEKEDENKLLYRKYNLYSTRSLLNS